MAKQQVQDYKKLPEGDIVRVLAEQHASIRELFAEVGAAEGTDRQSTFDALRRLLAVHEVAEEMVLRPTTSAQDRDVANARNEEEAAATKTLADLEGMDIDAPGWASTFDALRRAVEQHADHEETLEFPLLLEGCGPAERKAMGSRLKMVESFAPTHPHPSTAGSPLANWLVGPYVSMIDRARDAFSGKPE